jgi:hypothetical protein
MRRIALALDQNKVKVGEKTRTVCCNEQIVTLADRRRVPGIPYSGNQTHIADEMQSQCVSCSPKFDRQMTQINLLEVMQMRTKVCFDLTENSPEALQIALANSLCHGATGVLRCTVLSEPTCTPFPQSSISKLELAKNLLRPQSTLVLSTGEANVGAHNFSNEVSPSSVIEEEARATRLLGQNARCI